MKGFATSLLSLILMLSMAGCKKDKDVTTKPDPITVPDPVSKPVGTPIGALIKFSIGANGGSFETADKSISISVPAGAVGTQTEFSLQEITNTCAAGIGKSYSLTPHGINFQKPLIIKFAIPGEITSTDFLGIASQDNKGVWRMARNATVDKENKKVAVTTTHFSNWTLLQWLQLKPVSATLSPGEQLDLKVMGYIPTDGDILAPLVPGDGSEVGVGDGYLLPVSFIKDWQLAGPGSLNKSGATAKYSAPATSNGVKTAAVTAVIKDPVSQLMLVSNITIMGEGIAFRIGDGEWQYMPGYVIRGNDQFNLSCFEGDRYLAVDWPGGQGSFPWLHNPDTQKGEKAVGFFYTDETGRNYKSTYYQDEIFKDSGGSFIVNDWGEKNALITGSFTISRSAYFYGVDDRKEAGRTTIEAKFRVRRGN